MLAVATGLTSVANATVIYSHRNGVFTDHVDVGLGAPLDLWWANEFNAQPGGQLIGEVSIGFGQGFVAGTPVSVLVYEDLDDNGRPDNLSLVGRYDSTIQVVNTANGGTFLQTFDIPDVAVSGNFFVGALVLNAPSTAYIRSEITSPQHRSWVAYNETTLGVLDPANLAGIEQMPIHIEQLTASPNTPQIDWVIEATGQPLPEPTTLSLLAAGSILLRRTR